ncbi:unnamed protein product, partial [Prorocentrum cordatum]
VAINFEDDPNFRWHVRVLRVRLADGRWVGWTPDLDVVAVNLADYIAVPIPRRAPAPARVRRNLYAADALTEDELATVKLEADALGNVLGAAPAGLGAAPTAGALAAEWRFADTAHEKFGETVPPDITRNPLRPQARGATGPAEVEEGGETFWTFVEKVGDPDLDEWLEEKRSGLGRDPPVLSVHREVGRARYLSMREGLALMQFFETGKAPADWPFPAPAPSAIREVLLAARAAREELAGFHDFWARASGVNPDSLVALKHGDLIAVLHHMLSFDQLNLGQLSSADMLGRLILQIHQATKRNPKNPDFRGTDLMAMSTLDSSGGALSGEFARWTAEEQKSAAFAMKQQRLHQEEEDKRRGNRTNDKGGAREKDKDAMSRNVARAAMQFAPAPAASKEFPLGTLAELLQCKFIYDLDTTQADYDASKLRVLERGPFPLDALDVAGGECRRYPQDPDNLIALPPDELAAIDTPVKPHWDQHFAKPGAAWREFIQRLDKAGLVAWRLRARAECGAFFVGEKDDAIRLVLDCRTTNQLRRRAPKSHLATLGALGNLVLSDEWCELSAEALGPHDALDGFQFRVDSVASWFSLGESFTAAEAGVTTVYCDETGGHVEVGPEAAARRALASLGQPTATLADWAPPPPFCRDSVVIAPYVDNGNIIAGPPEAARRGYDAFRAELLRPGFALHEELETRPEFELVGREIRGRRRMLLPRRRRMWRLRFALDELLLRPALAPTQMRRVVEHLVDHFSARRELLSCLCSVYRFIGDGAGPARRLDTATLEELRVIQGPLPLAAVELGRSIAEVAFRSDASEHGFAAHQTRVGARLGFLRARPTSRASTRAGRRPGRGDFTDFAREHLLRDVADAWARFVPECQPLVGDPRRREAVIVGKWRRSDKNKIHNLEARAAPMGLEGYCADPAHHSTALLSLGDNMPEVLATGRGGSRTWDLLALVRRAGAGQAASNARWARRHIETHRNPSDYGSRLPHLQPGEVQRGAAARQLDAGRPRAALAPTPLAAARQRIRREPADRRPLRHQQYFLELFAGCMRLTACVAALGLAVAAAVDIDLGPHFDVSRARVADVIIDWIDSGLVWAVALGAPCTRWSTARHARHEGVVGRAGLACARFSVRVLDACARRGARVAVGNPWASRLWQWQPLTKQLRRLKCVCYRVDQCAYGAAWKKPTGLASNIEIGSAARRCPGCQRHVALQGKPRRGQRARRHNDTEPGFLRKLVATAATREKHERCYADAKDDYAGWDLVLANYTEGLYRASEAATAARHAFHGVSFVNDWPRRSPDLLPKTRLSLLAFARSSPERCRDPPAIELALLMLDHFLDQRFDCNLRPSEGPNLTAGAVGRPRPGAAAQGWTINVAPAEEDAKPPKNRRFDASVLAGAHDRQWVCRVLELLAGNLEPSNRVFRSLRLAALEKEYRAASASLGFRAAPHGLRRAGPSHDAVVHKQKIEDAQARGRRASLESLSGVSDDLLHGDPEDDLQPEAPERAARGACSPA